jgi:hypothetical protein
MMMLAVPSFMMFQRTVRALLREEEKGPPAVDYRQQFLRLEYLLWTVLKWDTTQEKKRSEHDKSARISSKQIIVIR